MPKILKNIQREPKKNQCKENRNKNHLDCGIQKALDFSLKPKAIATEYRD